MRFPKGIRKAIKLFKVFDYDYFMEFICFEKLLPIVLYTVLFINRLAVITFLRRMRDFILKCEFVLLGTFFNEIAFPVLPRFVLRPEKLGSL